MFYNVYAMHRNEDVFGTKAEEFVPERWQDLRPGWGYLPFNGGARACIGRKSCKDVCGTNLTSDYRTVRSSGNALRRGEDGADLQCARVKGR
jgi:hypothetical protein